MAPNHGMRQGMVVSLDETRTSVVAAVVQAEQLARQKITSAYVSVGGPHLAAQNSRGVVTFAQPNREIGPADVRQAIEQAQAAPLPADREMIAALPNRYILDGMDGVRSPIGMSAQRLEVELHIITGAVGSIQNVIRCVHQAGVEIDDLVVQALASSEAVVSEAERDLGVMVLDIGGGTTDVAIFAGGRICHTEVVPVGGMTLSNDIAWCLHTMPSVAEELKREYGHALPELVADLPPVEVPSFGETLEVPRSYLAQIIQARLEELLSMVHDSLKRAGYAGLLGAGVVLTGGTAELPGLKELAERVLEQPARLGTPVSLGVGAERLEGPAYATAVGLVLRAARMGGAGGQRAEHARPAWTNPGGRQSRRLAALVLAIGAGLACPRQVGGMGLGRRQLLMLQSLPVEQVVVEQGAAGSGRQR